MREEERGGGGGSLVFVGFGGGWRALRLNGTLLENGTLRYGCNGFIVLFGFLLLLYVSY